MNVNDLLRKVHEEVEKGLETCHCSRCSCMAEALRNIQAFVGSTKPDDLPPDFRARLESYLKKLGPTESS